jgi:hypothetical protein
MVNGMIGFDPKLKKKTFKTFWSLDPAWGVFDIKKKKIRLSVKSGCLSLNEIRLPFLKKGQVKAVKNNGKSIEFSLKKGSVVFKNTADISRKLTIIMK